MELRHLRYFVAVAEALSFTKAAARLRVAQPALSRQVHDLEEEIGVDLLTRTSRGVTLTEEGKLLLSEARELLDRTEDMVRKVRALARGEYGELNVGYSPSPTIELLPPALAAFQKAVPGVRVLLHDLSGGEIVEGLRAGALHLAVTPFIEGEQVSGIDFEALRTYPIWAVLAPGHPLARLKAIPLEKVATEPLVALNRKDYPDAYLLLERLFRPLGVKPRIAVECDSGSSVVTAIEAQRGITLTVPVFKLVTGKRLLYRPLTGTSDVLPVGIARARGGDMPPAGEKLCDLLRKVSRKDARV